MEGVIDTNILVASLVEEDVNHQEARKILEAMHRWFIPSIVFHEFAWFLKANRLSLKLILPYLHHTKTNVLEIKKEDIEFAAIKSGKKPAEYNDYLILKVALRTGKQLFTFDKKLLTEFRKLSKST